ncbi:hypothetical protein ABZW30_40430 [Kitasatospora sp. NPDC004669]|uniref:hypothetical protein n=1 Tax=Kitasatospora sp. NPDC004669 TaxID=3154555 RepID=UPI0033BD960B
MTPEQAVQQLNALLDDSMSGIRPPLLYWDGWPRSTEQSAEGFYEESLGYATATRDRYIMTKVARAKYGALLGVVERSWKAKGYTITAVSPEQPAIFASTPDGAEIAITFGAPGNITFTASVGPIPVIRDRDPFGVPVPEPVMANGNLDVIPRYKDPFWSV